MKVAILQGGMSSERAVSLNTAEAFAKALDTLKISYTRIDARKDVVEKIKAYGPDIVLIALHGKYAEDGTIQGICEYLKLPYTGSGVLASAITMDKILPKQILSNYQILTPEFQVLTPTDKAEDITIKLPFVVKPSREGSSVGISICKEKSQVQDALQLASQYDHKILVEKFIAGKEVTVPILQSKALTPIEIRPKQGFYNYENKYTVGNTEYILPPELLPQNIEKLKATAEKAFHILGMRTYGRIDFMLDENEEAYFIEANPLPGCTETSLLPKSAAYDGIAFTDFVKILLDGASLDYAGLS